MFGALGVLNALFIYAVNAFLAKRLQGD